MHEMRSAHQGLEAVLDEGGFAIVANAAQQGVAGGIYPPHENFDANFDAPRDTGRL
ncbi:MAG TPA: hypothetical protein VGF29_08150 [Hyphomicrobiaceae bacterium]|jgi:hypothetical protein